MSIAVVAAGADSTAVGVQQSLTRLGARVVFIDTTQLRFVLRERAPLAVANGVALDDARVVYVKSAHLSVPLFDLESMAQRVPKRWPERWIAERERHASVTSMFRALEENGAHFVNSVSRFEVHLLKPLQSVQLARAGIPVPASLTTNDPQAVVAFADQVGELIYKTPAGGALVRKFTAGDVKRLPLLDSAPVLFQQRIEGDELRVTVLAGKVVAAWKLPARGVVDAREVLHHAKKVTCPAEVARVCVKAAETLGLIFTSVDVRVADDGTPYVLECNPTPSIAHYPSASAVIRSLAKYLVDAAR